MTTYFVDTSALAKRYLNEIGSTWVISWIVGSAGNAIIVSKLAIVETCSVFARRVREGALSVAPSSTLRDNFLLHVESEYFVVKIDSQILI